MRHTGHEGHSASLASGADTPDTFDTLLAQRLKAISRGSSTNKKRKFAPHWQPHAWILVPRREIRRRDKTFRKHFPKAIPAVRKPMMIMRFDGNLAGIAYALKGDFSRRISLPKARRRDGKGRSRNVRYRPLRARQKLELMLMLDRIGLERRVFLYGVKVINKPTGQKIKALRHDGHG